MLKDPGLTAKSTAFFSTMAGADLFATCLIFDGIYQGFPLEVASCMVMKAMVAKLSHYEILMINARRAYQIT